MKNSRHNFNKNVRIDRICDDTLFRPAQSFIYFNDGYAYATDAHILVKAKLAEISTFQEPQLQILNGKAIHKSVFAKLLPFERVEIIEDGFKARVPEGNSFITFGFAGTEKNMVADIEKVILNARNDEQTGITSFGINPTLLKRLDCLFTDTYGVELIIKAPTKPILVKWSGHDAIGLIMPIMIND